MFFKRLLSYIFPITIYRSHSQISGELSVTLLNGKPILNSTNTDYSFGSLQRVLRFGLKKIGFETIRQQKKILVLGLAGASVVQTLINEIKFNGKIYGVDIDKEVIELGRLFFQLDKIKNLQIFIEDAQEYIKNNTRKYDLIIIDIFEDKKMPDFLFNISFFKQLYSILSKKGIILFNTIVENKKEASRNKDLTTSLEELYQISVFSKVEEGNEPMIFTRKIVSLRYKSNSIEYEKKYFFIRLFF